MANILEINEYYMNVIWIYKPIQDQSKTIYKPFLKREANLKKSGRAGISYTKIIFFLKL